MRPYSSGNEKDTQQKRSRHEVHSISEKRRRSQINGKLKTLQELMPHCKKKDRASILDEAAKYIKALQHHVETMTKLRNVEYIGQSQYMPCSMNPGLQYPYASMPQGAGMCIGCYAHCTPFFQVPSPSSTMANYCVPTTRPLHGN
ncbi:transcription factor PHYTOCHROME INTERACTING FACTOR-LIKE 13-like [Silene latifolia]|uniref:transcription factor PHYTOCHROME INTERACTING FACTOR-LIKE 13-like n=1 Tax=Silene latifolia TaxID=37657 RepID=UPI003D76DDC9